jgi:serine/threonine protein kinase
MHTMSGTVVGTASYMPPEQAEGSRNIGPHSDVYALGAILYELLTGQPPFRAENVVDTMLQVLHQEPKAPSSLRQGVPAELEVISLKCLEKNPTSRYQSAEELAKDLRRYLDCEPILARPPSAVERVQKWTRKHPAVAALIAVSVVAFVLFLSLWANFTARLQYKKDLLEAKHQLILEKQSDDERIQGIIRQQNDRTERILHATLSAIADFTDSQRDKKLLESERHQPGLLPYQLACALSQACSLIDDDYDMPADEKARLKKQYVDQACELLRVARALDPKMNVAKSLRDSAELAPLRKHIRYQELASELDRAAP